MKKTKNVLGAVFLLYAAGSVVYGWSLLFYELVENFRKHPAQQ